MSKASKPLHRYRFVQAVRHFTRSGGAPLGHDHPPREEAVRLAVDPGLGRPSGEIVSVRLAQGTAVPPELRIGFFGLTGPAGILPPSYTDVLLQRTREHDDALRDFLDFFNHRALSFFYRAWEKCHLPAAYEAQPGQDHLSRALRAVVGEARDQALFFSGAYANPRRPAHLLAAYLTHVAGVPVSVESFQARWSALLPADRSRLGGPWVDPERFNNRLGQDTVLGTRMLSADSAFRIVVGPLDRHQFADLVPGGAAFRRLCHAAQLFSGGTLECDVRYQLRPDAIPPLRLGGRGPQAAHLGWNTWLPLTTAGQSYTSLVVAAPPLTGKST